MLLRPNGIVHRSEAHVIYRYRLTGFEDRTINIQWIFNLVFVHTLRTHFELPRVGLQQISLRRDKTSQSEKPSVQIDPVYIDPPV